MAPIHHGPEAMEEKTVVAPSEILVDVVSRDIFWIAFLQFFLLRPVLHLLPNVKIGNWLVNLAISSGLTLATLTLLVVLPLYVFDYIPIPRTSEIRRAYLCGFIAGGLLTHLLWLVLVKFSIVQTNRD